MKGNYYLFEPLVDEKGEQMVRVPGGGDAFIMDDEFVTCDHEGQWLSEYPILTMKKFDHDPFERLKKIISNYDSSDLQAEAGKIVFEMHQAISETVKELEGK